MRISRFDFTGALCALLIAACVSIGIMCLVAPRELLSLWWPQELLARMPEAALLGRAHTGALIALVGSLFLVFILRAGPEQK